MKAAINTESRITVIEADGLEQLVDMVENDQFKMVIIKDSKGRMCLVKMIKDVERLN